MLVSVADFWKNKEKLAIKTVIYYRHTDETLICLCQSEGKSINLSCRWVTNWTSGELFTCTMFIPSSHLQKFSKTLFTFDFIYTKYEKAAPEFRIFIRLELYNHLELYIKIANFAIKIWSIGKLAANIQVSCFASPRQINRMNSFIMTKFARYLNESESNGGKIIIIISCSSKNEVAKKREKYLSRFDYMPLFYRSIKIFEYIVIIKNVFLLWGSSQSQSKVPIG